jgi:cytochrome b561
MHCHRQAGNFVLLALVLRLAVRLRIGLADHAGDMPVLVRAAAQVAHVGLYALLAALPALGLAASNAHGIVVSLFGLFPLPVLVSADPDLADTLTDFHLWAAWALLLLVSAHVVAALWHHAVRRDGVLAAMCPWVERQSGTD